MARPWLRLDAHFYTDGRLRKAGPDARVCWPSVLAVLKGAGGVATDEDLDPDVLADLIGGDPSMWRRGIDGLQAAGLLVRGTYEIRERRSTDEREGWSTPKWSIYQPDDRSSGVRLLPAAKAFDRGQSVSNALIPMTRRDATRQDKRTSSDEEPKTKAKTKAPKPSPGLPLAEELREAIRTHSPRVAARYETPARLAGWARDLERLLRIDGADPAEVRGVVRWAHVQDPSGFWRGNLLSGAKVRQHFDRLLIQARGRSGARVAVAGGQDGWMREHHRWLLRWRDEAEAVSLAPSVDLLASACAADGVPLPPDSPAALAWLRGR